MKDSIVEAIDTLPPLNITTIELISLLQEHNQDKEKIINIINKDPFIIATLFKTANSALFGFKNKFETIENIVNIFGTNLTLSIAIGLSIKRSLDIDLNPYNIDQNSFKDNILKMLSILNQTSLETKIKEEICLPLFLLNIGKAIVSDILKKNNLDKSFKNDIQQNCFAIEDIERKYINTTSYNITYQLLIKWDFPDHILDILHDFNNNKTTLYARVIDVIETICKFCSPCLKESIRLGLDKAKKYQFDIDEFQKIVDDISNIN